MKKNILLGVLVCNLIGCASVGSVSNKMVQNQKGGFIYGAAGVDTTVSVLDLCKSIKNQDPRCESPNDYVVMPVLSKFGYADGAVGINALLRKDHNDFDKIKSSTSAFDKNGVFVKAEVIPGQLGQLVEVVSVEKDGKCSWSGLPKVGGVICPAYNYDYRNDFIGVVFR